tara:strand:+ start:76 stop:969 length:894 start_codon:yes stop_codon:yes gene_type:complete
MAENAVELDTDGIEEKQIAIEETQADANDKPEVGEVDLGYTDPIKKDAKAKVVTKESDESGDDLVDHSEKVQNRINKLTRKMREAERRERAALDYAKGLQMKYSKVEKDLQKTDKSFVEEYENRVDAETDKVKTQMKNAMQDQDYDKMMEANQNLTRLAVEKEKATMRKAEIEESLKQPQQEEQPVQQPPSPRAQEWADNNTWFGKDKVMTNAAFTIHEDLVQKGFDPESDEYYTEIDKQLQDNFPSKFVKERPVQTVASAGRKQQGRRKVTLTRSQVAIAKKLGVPLEEYAKFVKE